LMMIEEKILQNRKKLVLLQTQIGKEISNKSFKKP